MCNQFDFGSMYHNGTENAYLFTLCISDSIFECTLYIYLKEAHNRSISKYKSGFREFSYIAILWLAWSIHSHIQRETNEKRNRNSNSNEWTGGMSMHWRERKQRDTLTLTTPIYIFILFCSVLRAQRLLLLYVRMRLNVCFVCCLALLLLLLLLLSIRIYIIYLHISGYVSYILFSIHTESRIFQKAIDSWPRLC